MNSRPAYVSVIDPIGPAIERVRTVLFRPFDLGKWCVIGFSAWLAQLGTGGGNGGGGGGSGGDGAHRPEDITDEIRHGYEVAREYVAANLYWILPVAIFVLIVFISVWLLITWLSSRGRFTFLYCVAQNKGEFWNPWRLLLPHGNNLFGFRVALGIIWFLTGAAFLAAGGVLAFFAHQTLGFTVVTILGLVMCGLLFFATMIVFGIIAAFTTDFVVPIMYVRRLRCRPAWRVFLEVLSENKGRFFVYLLFQIVITIALGAIAVGMMCVCCAACCLFMLPYVGTVLLLPLSVFRRSYSLYYLAQYGPQFNVFPREPKPEVVEPSPGWQS
ncbi:MAG: hypothetical protein JSW27_21685 [Phycisphaerales bacterium]|nr:MAG: hypothetical protein JSW27_21685 [Phycisphaerales bacterium]